VSDKRIFIIIDKTDSEFLDKIVKEIQESEKGRRAQKTTAPGPLSYGSHPRRAALKNSDEERG